MKELFRSKHWLRVLVEQLAARTEHRNQRPELRAFQPR